MSYGRLLSQHRYELALDGVRAAFADLCRMFSDALRPALEAVIPPLLAQANYCATREEIQRSAIAAGVTEADIRFVDVFGRRVRLWNRRWVEVPT